MNNEVLLNIFKRIQRDGSLNSSAISASTYRELLNMGESRGFLIEEKAGRGKCLKIVNARILELEIKRLEPQIDNLDSLPNRVKNLAVNQDTKIGETTLDYTYCVCKAVGENVIVNGVDVSLLTASLGCFSLPISDNNVGVQCSASLMLVENQQLIDDLKWLPADFTGVVLYYAGNLSERVLNWIKQSTFASVWHFPDYDAVGISNYANLKNVLPEAQWYWMPNWKSVFEKFGNKDLWAKDNQHAMFENLWAKFMENGFPDSQLKDLMEECRKQGKMLEQESVLL